MPAEPDVKRVVAFFDGQNLFHTAAEGFAYNYPNFNPKALATKIAAEQGWELAQVRFYTGIADAKRDPFWHHLTAGKDSSQNPGGCFASCTIADYLSDSTSRKAPFFKKSEIQGEVDACCAKYKIDQQQVPLDVELIVKADLRLELRPEANLFKKTEIDALLTSNRKTIMVDLDRFTRKNLQNRLRFTKQPGCQVLAAVPSTSHFVGRGCHIQT